MNSAPIRDRLSVAQVVAGLSKEYGGPSYSVPRLCDALASIGINTTLLSVAEHAAGPSCSSSGSYDDWRFTWDHSNVPGLKILRKSNELTRALRRLMPKTDIVHNHGLWLLPNLVAGREALRAKRPLIVSPRGMLSPTALSFSPWKKRTVWLLSQRSMVRRAACIHATSDLEYQEIRALGFSNPIAIIPNGIDMIEPTRKAEELEQQTVLSLGRLHPKKGLEQLLRAWVSLEARFPNWSLRIVGPSEDGYDEKLQRVANDAKLLRVSIEPAAYGGEKKAIYEAAHVFVLSTLSENFGLTVAEALSAGIPVVSSKGAPWQGLELEKCGWWIDKGVEPLTKGLAIAMSLPREELTAMGKRGREWMARDFSWNGVAQRMRETYEWTCGLGPAPSAVRLD